MNRLFANKGQSAALAHRWLWLAALVVVLDQASKAWVELSFEPYESLSVLPFFNLTLVYNRGAAFSFLSDAGGWQRIFFVVLTVVILVFLLRWLRSLGTGDALLAVALSLVIGGAIGNLIDRIVTGRVVDFLDVYYQQWHWPAFNVADSAISIGVVLLLYDTLFGATKAQGGTGAG
jgi:signal peptidase II